MATTHKTERARYSSGPYLVRRMQEAASQSWHPGQFVYLSSTGLVTACASNAILCCGMAEGYATGVTNAWCEIVLAGPDTTFEMTISGTSDPTVADADQAVQLGMLVANNRTYADVDDTTAEAFVFCGYKQIADGTNVVGDDDVRGYVKLLEREGTAGTAVNQYGDAAYSA